MHIPEGHTTNHRQKRTIWKEVTPDHPEEAQQGSAPVHYSGRVRRLYRNWCWGCTRLYHRLESLKSGDTNGPASPHIFWCFLLCFIPLNPLISVYLSGQEFFKRLQIIPIAEVTYSVTSVKHTGLTDWLLIYYWMGSYPVQTAESEGSPWISRASFFIKSIR